MDKENLKKLFPYVITFFAFVLTIFLIIVIIDQWILPSIVHNIEKVKVPNVIGKSYDQAVKILEENNLEYKRYLEQYNDEYPKNTIINQTPKPSVFVKEGRQILLTVSKGSMIVKMPYVIKLPLRKARLELLKKGIYISKIDYVHNDSIGIDTVLAQSINPGNSINSGVGITLTVSKGPMANIKVPMLTGKTLQEVEEILSELELELGTVNNTYEEIFEATFVRNTVVSQYPQAGELVPKHSKVDVTIYR